MKRVLIILTLAATLLTVTSCVSNRKVSTEGAGFRPDVVRLDMTMQDYEYMGDVTVSAEYTRYIGIFVKVRKINDEDYNPRNRTYTKINMDPKFSISDYLHQALYKVTELYPNADYIIPASYKANKQIMNGGRYVREEMTVKVFRLKQQAQVQPQQ